MNTILLEPAELCGRAATLTGTRARHAAEILSAQPGDTIRIGVIDGPLGRARIESIAADRIELVVDLEAVAPPEPRIDLLLALPRPKVLKRLWAQLAALGVGRILLTNAAKVERNYFDTHVLREEFYRPLLIEGLQQACDTRLPRVSVHRRFRPFVEDELAGLSGATVRLVADPSCRERLSAVAAPGRVLLAVGPEGGWTPFELELLGNHGFKSVGLGPRILRTDTACVALLALMNDALAQASDS